MMRNQQAKILEPISNQPLSVTSFELLFVLAEEGRGFPLADLSMLQFAGWNHL